MNDTPLVVYPLRVAEKGRPEARGSPRLTYMGSRDPLSCNLCGVRLDSWVPEASIPLNLG